MIRNVPRAAGRALSSPTMAKKPARAAASAAAAPVPRNDAADTPEAGFLVMSIMSAVVPMIEAKCGQMNKRDRGTLQRRIEKAVRGFIRGAKK